jgi:hypothetical protein
MSRFSEPRVFTADALQWMHFAAIGSDQCLREAQQTLEGKRGILGKRLRDALVDLFSTEDAGEIQRRDLLIFDANDEFAWINPHDFYFVPDAEVTTEIRFPAIKVFKALIGALIITKQGEAGDWFALLPGKKNFDLLTSSRAYRMDTGLVLFRLLELLVRGFVDMKVSSDPDTRKQLIQACRQNDLLAARQLEILGWNTGDANLWRYAMAVADGKTRLARMFADRLPGCDVSD